MTYGEYVKQYVTLDNALEYASVTDKLVYVSDLIGLSVDHRFTSRIEDRFDVLTQTKLRGFFGRTAIQLIRGGHITAPDGVCV